MTTPVLINHQFNNPQPDDAGPHVYTLPSDWNAAEMFGGGSTDGDLVTWDPASSTKASYRTLAAGAGITVTISAGQILISASGSDVTGSGTPGKLTKWNTTTSIEDSLVSEDAYGLLISEDAHITGSLTIDDDLTLDIYSVVTNGTFVGGTWNGNIIGAQYGGTGQGSYTIGDLLYASGASALARLADVAAGSYLRSGGASVAPLWSTLILPNAATANRIVYATSTNTWGDSANLTFDGSTLTLVGDYTMSGKITATNNVGPHKFGTGDATATTETPFLINMAGTGALNSNYWGLIVAANFAKFSSGTHAVVIGAEIDFPHISGSGATITEIAAARFGADNTAPYSAATSVYAVHVVNGILAAYGGDPASVSRPSVGLANNQTISWRDSSGVFTSSAFFYQDTSDYLHVGTGGATRHMFTPAGGILIGLTADPGFGNSLGRIVQLNNTTHFWTDAAGGATNAMFIGGTSGNSLILGTGNTTRLTIDSSGNSTFAAGTLAAAGQLNLGANGAGSFYLTFNSSNGSASGFKFQDAGSDKWVIDRPGTTDDLRYESNSASKVLYLTNAGNVGFGDSVASASSMLKTFGGGLQIANPTGGDQGAGTINVKTGYYANGTAGVSAGSFSTITAITATLGLVTQLTGTSDERRKHGIVSYYGSMAQLRGVKPISFQWNEDTGFDPLKRQYGFSAQNLLGTMPEAVEMGADGYYQLNQWPILGALVNGVNDLDIRIARLETELAALKASRE
jgi:hypothetical protein